MNSPLPTISPLTTSDSAAHSNLVDDAHYAESFAAFLSRLDYPEALFPWLETRFAHPGVRRLLCVGAGTGSVELPMIERLQELERVDLIEPNPEHAATLEPGLERACQRTRGVTRPVALVVRTTFERWEAPAAYDLVVFCNSLYFLPTPREMIARALRMLAPGGRVVIIHEHPMGAMYQLQTSYYAKLGRPMGREVYYTAADILSDLLTLQADPEHAIGALDLRVEIEHATLDVRGYPRRVLEFLFEAPIESEADYAAKVAHICTRYPDPLLPQPYSVITVSQR